MGRIIGLIGCLCLVIVTLRMTNLQYTDHTLKGGEDRVHAGGKLSPREHYKLGKEMFLRGKYRDAVQHLDAATVTASGLTGTERRQADDYLTRARTRLQAAAAGTTVRGQSEAAWDEAPSDEASSSDIPVEAARNRVETQMDRAQAALKFGDRAEAKRLATQALQLAREAKLTFDKNDLTPGAFLAELDSRSQEPGGLRHPAQKSVAGPKPQAGAASNSNIPDWATDDASVGNAAKTTSARKTIQQTGAKAELGLDDSPVQQANSSSEPLSAHTQAAALVVQARKDFKAGRYEEARRKALAADELDVTYDLFEDRPQHLLADIDRVTNTTTFANATRKPASAPPKFTPQNVDGNARPQPVNSRPDILQTTDSRANPVKPSLLDSKKQRAARLLELAKKDLADGNLDGAQTKAEEAAELNVAYQLFDDLPELVLRDIAARRASEGIANANALPSAKSSPKSKPQAIALLKKARLALAEDRLDEARQLAIEAERLHAAYDLFDDRPDQVLADVARTAKRGPTNAGMPVGDASTAQNIDGASNNVNAAAAAQNLSPAQQQAKEMLRQARQLIKAGRYDEARVKVDEAEQMNVTFPVFADRPDLVLADLDAKLGNGAIASLNTKPRTAEVETAGGFDTAPVESNANPFAPDSQPPMPPPATGGRNFGGVTQADSITEISPSGPSAGELYNRGMMELNRGNRQGAYAQFLAAHQSGQKLDYVRSQRMQDYLRELAPKSRNIIQTNGQVSDTDIALLPEGNKPAPLDAAQQEQMVKFDRIRSDVLNAVFKAERLRGTDPEAALTLIDQAMSKVESAELSEESATSLMKQLNKTRSSLQHEIVQQKPNLDLNRRNKEVKDILNREVENNVRIEQEFAKLVDEFNDLMKQKRFAEAEILAKKAKEMNPNDPTATTLFWKSRLGRRVDSNAKLQLDREESFWEQLNDVENAAIVKNSDSRPLVYGDGWNETTKRRKGRYRTDNRKRGEAELKIESSLVKRISLHEDQVTLGEVMNKIRAIADINIVIDQQGLEEEGVNSNSLVSIEVDSISVKSALNLILNRYNLSYMIDNEVLKITSRMRTQGELIVTTYSVADLVIPIPDPSDQIIDPFSGVNSMGFGGGQMSIPAGQGFGQIGQNATGAFDPSAPTRRQKRNSTDPDFESLTDLIVSTIAPDTWEQVGGPANIRSHETTLSLVIRQTQKIHEEITDLLDQLRRLQDLQVTIEVRFVTVSDRFFERIGIDFNFNMAPTTGFPTVDNSGLPLQTFGSVNLPQFGMLGNQAQQAGGVAGVAGAAGGVAGAAGGVAGAAGGQAGAAGGVAGAAGGQAGQAGGAAPAAGFFGAGPSLNLYNNPSNPSIVGMKNSTTFTQDLSVPFSQGSFSVGVPTFGSYNPKAGMEMGLAILSDIEAFFFIQAAQGDQRNNLMFAPKVTVFNGQTGRVMDAKSRPFVVSLIPTVGFASTGFQPVIQNVNEGIQLSVTAVVSSDRRYVRLSVSPQFNSITDVFTFSFIGGGGGGGGQAGGGGQGGQQGGQGGFGGGQFGGGGGQGGGGQGLGIGGGIGGAGGAGGIGGQQGGQGGGQQGQGGNRGGGGQTITVQQPVVETVTVLTTVSVPDGGTILLGGVKRLKEGRNMAGVPILNKIPYVSRLFKNTGVGRETESLMLMITPRIIIQEEEEELLGLPR